MRTAKEIRLPHYAKTKERLDKEYNEFVGFYMSTEDIKILKKVFEEGNGLTKIALDAKMYDLCKNNEDREKCTDFLIKLSDKHYFPLHNVELKKHIIEVFFTPNFEISAVVFGRIAYKRDTLVRVYRKIPKDVLDAWNPLLKEKRDFFEKEVMC